MMVISNGTREGSWHVGENMHIPDGPVLTFQVDGDELNWLLRAISYQLTVPVRDRNDPGLRVIYPSTRLTPVF